MNQQTPAGGAKRQALNAMRAALGRSPAPALCLASLLVGWLAQRAFFHFAPELWARQAPLDLSTVTPWALPQFTETDGAEPVGLLAAVVLATLMLCALGHGLKLASPRVRGMLSVLGLVAGVLLLRDAGFALPGAVVGSSLAKNSLLVLAAVVASLVIGWQQEHGRTLSVASALWLVLIVLVPSGGTSPGDAQAILSPAWRLLHGAAPAHIYMQYDYLPSLLLEAWLWLGGNPSGIFFLTGLCYCAFLSALFVLARRWFLHPGLAGPLLVALLIVRVSAGMTDDVTAIPQVSPLRLDLWIVPVALALRFGLRHWAVALALGLTCIFSRSIGVLYLGGYGLAVGADLFAARLSLPDTARVAWATELAQFCRRLLPSLLVLLGCIGLTALIFGSPISDAALLYRRLGVSQIRIVPSSFYWWLLPLTALSAGLAFWQRAELGEKRGSALLLLVGLLISSSIYFFGRSHENNLLNLSAPFLTCYFLCLDRLLARRGAPASVAVQAWLSSLLIALCAWQYSGKIWTRSLGQVAALTRTDLTPPIVGGRGLPRVYCPELAKAVADRKLYLFSELDFWAYAECDYVPQGYMQPMGLEVLKAPLIAEMNRLLDQGYTVAVRKTDALASCFSTDFLPGLSAAKPTAMTESAHYRFVKRK